MKNIESFRRHLQRLGYGKTSVQMLPTCVEDFLKYTAKSIQNITSHDILNYKTHLEQRPKKVGHGGLSESYIHHHIYGLKWRCCTKGENEKWVKFCIFNFSTNNHTTLDPCRSYKISQKKKINTA